MSILLCLVSRIRRDAFARHLTRRAARPKPRFGPASHMASSAFPRPAVPSPRCTPLARLAGGGAARVLAVLAVGPRRAFDFLWVARGGQ